MTAFAWIKRCALLGCLCALLSCSGGGTGGTGIDAQPGRMVLVFGVVTNVDKLVVNGITFDTTKATLTRNGEPGRVADLRLGQVVTVQGTLEPSQTTVTATTVMVARHAVGPITRLDPATRQLVVLGQLVLIDDLTRFGTAGLGDLVVGNIVEVSGLVDANGVLRATRLEKTQDAFFPGLEIETSGVITTLDAVRRTFTLQRVEVDFSAAQLRNIPGGQLRSGQFVTASSRRNVQDGVLLAERVIGQDVGLRGDTGTRVELTGLITRRIAADLFAVNGQVVRLTPVTVFAGGTADHLAVNTRVEVEGVLDADGVIIAEEVDIGDDGMVEVAGVITQITSAETFAVSGQVVRLTPATVFMGGTASNLAVQVPVDVEGFFDSDGVLVATVVEFPLVGAITRVLAADTFEINGRVVRFTSATVFEGGTASDLVVHVRVEVTGVVDASGVVLATSIEFLE